MPIRWTVLAALVLCGPAALAQPAGPDAVRRFPQPVRVGDLVGRTLLQPTEAQQDLGRVRAVVRRADGGVAVVVAHGGLLGFGTRMAAVPADAVALLGQHLQLVGLSPAELDRLPPFDPAGTEPLPADGVIRMGLAKPAH